MHALYSDINKLFLSTDCFSNYELSVLEHFEILKVEILLN